MEKREHPMQRIGVVPKSTNARMIEFLMIERIKPDPRFTIARPRRGAQCRSVSWRAALTEPEQHGPYGREVEQRLLDLSGNQACKLRF